jgi:1,6-anhydro-N-acetylmuramate kinase
MLAAGLVASGTLGGISAALIKTDGDQLFEVVSHKLIDFTPAMQELIAETSKIAATYPIVSPDPDIENCAQLITQLLYEGLRQVVRAAGIEVRQVEVIGGFGFPVSEIKRDFTHWQIGDFALIAREAGVQTFANFQREVNDDEAPALVDFAALDGASLAYIAARRLLALPIVFPAENSAVLPITQGSAFVSDPIKWT